KAELLEYARRARPALGKATDPLVKMRLNQMQTLQQLEAVKDSRTLIWSILEELCSYPQSRKSGGAPTDATVQACLEKLRQGSSELEASDVHLAAVLLHRLGEEKFADSMYEAAIEKYQQERHDGRENRALQALCHADYGFFEFYVHSSHEQAAKH